MCVHVAALRCGSGGDGVCGDRGDGDMCGVDWVGGGDGGSDGGRLML